MVSFQKVIMMVRLLIFECLLCYLLKIECIFNFSTKYTFQMAISRENGFLTMIALYRELPNSAIKFDLACCRSVIIL